MENNSLQILEVPISIFESYRHAEEDIVERILKHEKTFCVAINPAKIYHSNTNKELKRLIQAANLHICDGVGAMIAVLLLYHRRIPRITGIQLFLHLIERAASEGISVFLLGAKPESNYGAYKNLLEKYPRLRIVGHQNGYFSDDLEVVKTINESGAEMLFVAMGSPKQETWIAKYRDRIDAHFCMGVGGTFDVISGRVKWAPKFFRNTGTEWLFRFINEPKRIKRHPDIVKFTWLVFKEVAKTCFRIRYKSHEDYKRSRGSS